MIDLLHYIFYWTLSHPAQGLVFWCFQLIVGFLVYAALSSPAGDGHAKWTKLSLGWKIVLAPLAAYYPVDVVLRLFWTLVCWEVPDFFHNCTITAWCDSHCLDSDGASIFNWKRGMGIGMCRVLCLFQPGHCPHYKA